MHDHANLIDKLGGGSRVADWLSEQTGDLIDREAVYKWKRNGIAWRYRPFIAVLARERQVAVPPGFLPEGIVHNQKEVIPEP